MKRLEEIKIDLSKLDKSTCLRENLMLGFAEANKDNSETMLKLITEVIGMLRDKQNQFMARHAAKIDQNSFELQNIRKDINRMNLEICNLGKGMADLKKGIEDNNDLTFKKIDEMIRKIGNGEQFDVKRERDGNSDSNSDDEDKYPLNNPILKEEGKKRQDIIEILRRDRGINIVNDDKMIKTFTWGTEIDLLLKIWNKCKEDNAKTRKKAEKYASNIMDRNEKWFIAPRGFSIRNLDKRIISKKTTKIEDKLKQAKHVPHPFILQCIHQNCVRWFKRREDLMEHFRMEHQLGEIVIAKMDVRFP
jgi:hypothetical protein